MIGKSEKVWSEQKSRNHNEGNSMKTSASLLVACFLALGSATTQEVLPFSKPVLASKTDNTLAEFKHQWRWGLKYQADDAPQSNTSKRHIFNNNKPSAAGREQSISEFLAPPVRFLGIMGLTAAVGLIVYFVSYKLIARTLNHEEVKDTASNLFRFAGVLVGLFLSLTFADVIINLNAIKSASNREAWALADIYYDLQHFGVEEARSIQALLRDYTQAVIEDDWPALKDDRLSERTYKLLQQIEEAVLNLETTNVPQETLRSLMIEDVDLISDYRLSRKQQAREQPPFFIIIVLFGFLVTMVCFGLYRPVNVLVVLMSLHALLVGLSISLTLSLSDPFEGMLGIDPRPFEEVLEFMSSQNEPGSNGLCRSTTLKGLTIVHRASNKQIMESYEIRLSKPTFN